VPALANVVRFPDPPVRDRPLAAAPEDARVDDIPSEIATHIASMRRYALALLRDRGDADDLVQEALARALSRVHQFRPGTNLRAWLFTILHNVHVNHIRAKVVRPGEVPVEDVEMRLGVPGRQDARIELRDMARAVEALPEEQRRVLLMVGLEGMKYDEVATALGIPIGTVMSRLSRAREAVRQRIAGSDARPAGPTLRRIK
jgi:RNA polymerase sigma-70 factor (ECF subfamily)